MTLAKIAANPRDWIIVPSHADCLSTLDGRWDERLRSVRSFLADQTFGQHEPLQEAEPASTVAADSLRRAAADLTERLCSAPNPGDVTLAAGTNLQSAQVAPFESRGTMATSIGDTDDTTPESRTRSEAHMPASPTPQRRPLATNAHQLDPLDFEDTTKGFEYVNGERLSSTAPLEPD
jgi:hypothetical protein